MWHRKNALMENFVSGNKHTKLCFNLCLDVSTVGNKSQMVIKSRLHKSTQDNELSFLVAKLTHETYWVRLDYRLDYRLT